ncbi:MAG: indoleacetamide hydrolase [Burkholderiales bacterium]|nr:indoleacetamide hydrolase [Burkholderiales bacterium]
MKANGAWLAALLTAVSAGAWGASLDLDSLTASDAAQAICKGKLSSESLTRAYIERAKARPELNAFITLDEPRALAAARAADRAAAAGRCGMLQGVPVVIKDNINVAGVPTSAGTPALRDFVPRLYAPVVWRLMKQGAVVLGKTNMHELAFGISGYNLAFKTGPEPGVRNAYDPTRIAGGSSSGTGAAIGARLAPAGLGTDTGGSVRIPCAVNGCAALRPTVGRYPQAGIAPISHTRDTAGPMALSVEDLVRMDRAIGGGGAIAPAALGSVRLGVAKVFFQNLDADTQAAVDAALERMKQAGVTLVEVDLSKLFELNGAVGFPVALYEAHVDMVRFLARNGTGVTIAQLAENIASPDVKGTYQGLVLPKKLPGPKDTVVDAKPAYDAAMREGRPALIRYYRDAFRKHRIDALVFPTVPQVAIASNPDSSSLKNFLLFIQNTDPGSNAGLPGLTLPVALGASSRLPIGIELDGPAHSDRRLLAIGLALEKLFGRLPPPGK